MLSRHVVLIHGTGCTGASWAQAEPEFGERGFHVHTPTLRYHDLPLAAGAQRIAGLSLLDYTEDLVDFVAALDEPPLLVGLSMGGLLAQLVAARTPHAGLVAAAAAPAAGIFAMYPSMVRMWGPHFVHPRPWRRPLYPNWKNLRWAMTRQSDQHLRELFSQMKCESGRAYCEMTFPYLDRRRAAAVDVEKIAGPVLVLGAEHDRAVAPQVARATARRYRDATYVEIPGADHLLFDGAALPVTMRAIDAWLAAHHGSGR